MTHLSPPVDWERADPEARRTWLAHLEGCSRCRDAWTAEDPSRTFLLLAGDPLQDPAAEEAALERLSEAVSGRIRRPQVPFRALYRLAAAAVLAAALLVPAASWFLRDRPQPVPSPLAHVEVLSTPGEAQVIDLSVGDTQVVMIFDSRLEI